MLEIWDARVFKDVNEEGKTLPMLIECAPPQESIHQEDLFSPRREPFLVKSIGHPEIFEGALLNECLGSVLAQHFGILTPHPALISLSPTFVSAVQRSPLFQQRSQGRIHIQPGVGFGSKYIRNLATLKHNHEIKLPKDVAHSAMIYAFDMLVQNPDRRVDKPNAAMSDAGIVAMDFELCFSFLYNILGGRDPWRIPEDIARKHIFFKSLKGKVVDWKPFIYHLSELDDKKIETMSGRLHYRLVV